MKAALVIIDMQMLMQHRLDAGRDHVNADAPSKVAALAAAFRQTGRRVIHVRHGDIDPSSPMHPSASGYATMPCAEAHEGEPIFIKTTSSPFASTRLEKYLHDEGIVSLFVAGAVAGFCVNTTVRAGSDLGFRMTVVRDAVLGFDLPSENLPARTIFDVTMAHLKCDFAEIDESSSVIAGYGTTTDGAI
jgi:nicotinamidase-related amidase